MKANELNAILDGLAPFLKGHSGAIHALTARLNQLEARIENDESAKVNASLVEILSTLNSIKGQLNDDAK